MDAWLNPELASLLLKYSPSQARDNHGRWTVGTAGGAALDPLDASPNGTFDDLTNERLRLKILLDARAVYDQKEPPGVTKARIADALAADLQDNPYWNAMLNEVSPPMSSPEDRALVSNQQASMMVDAWAESADGQAEMSVLMQHAIQQEFGLKGAETGHMAWEASWEEDARVYTPGMRAFARVMYNQTQGYLAAHGITSIAVYRGVQLPDDVASASGMQFDAGERRRYARVNLAPASSFSVLPGEAYEFAGQYEDYDAPDFKAVIATRVPARNVLSTCQTGVGCKKEGEVVVLGDVDQSVSYFGWDSRATNGPDQPNVKGLELLSSDTEAFSQGSESPPDAKGFPPFLWKYSPSQARDRHGRWTVGGSGWRPLSSIPQINISLMAKHPFCGFDFTGSTVENANAVADAVEQVAKEYPEVFKQVRFIGTGEGPNSDPYWDTYWHAHNAEAVSTSKMEIALNPRVMGSNAADALMLAQEQDGYWPPGTASVQATFVHEFGHLVNRALASSGDQPSPWHKGKTVGQELKELDAQYGDEGLNVSGYARDSFETKHTYGEVWADSFSASHFSPPDFQDMNGYVVRQQELLAHVAHGQVPLKTPARPAS